jgi:hypothetical protein
MLSAPRPLRLKVSEPSGTVVDLGAERLSGLDDTTLGAGHPEGVPPG